MALLMTRSFTEDSVEKKAEENYKNFLEEPVEHNTSCESNSRHICCTFQESTPLLPFSSHCDCQSKSCEIHENCDNMKQDKEKKKSSKVLNCAKEIEPVLGLHKSKPLCLEQHLASKAQMHALTHSHSISRCYCTQTYSAAKRPQKSSVLSYVQRQHIPSRLTEQRYKAQLISRKPRAVHWADNRLLTHYDDCFHHFKGVPPISKSVCNGKCNFDQSSESPSSCKGHYQDLINDVKKFRKSHWSDCHAQSKAGAIIKHKNVQHYLLNERFYLEPVHAENPSSCLICLLSPYQVSTNSEFWSDKTKLHEDHETDFVVTLPTFLLDNNLFSAQTLSSNAQKNLKRQYNDKRLFMEPKLCRVKSNTLKQYLPMDSYALNHQRN